MSADSYHVLGVKKKNKTVNKVVELVAEGSVINKSSYYQRFFSQQNNIC